MTRRRWAVTILAAWAVSLGWLLKRELFKPTAVRLAEAARAIPPGATFYRLDLAGAQVGFASSTIDTLGDSIRVDETLVLEYPTLGRLSRTTARSTAIMGRSLRLRSLELRFDGDLGNFAAQGEVAGDSVLRLVLTSAADTQTVRVPLARPVVLPALLALRLAFGGELQPGTTRGTRIFDPVLLAERDMEVAIVRESTLIVVDSADFDSTAMAWVPALLDTVPAVRIELTGEAVATTAWVDAQGRLIRAINPLGFLVERSAFEIAYENFRRRDTVRAIEASRHAPDNALIAATALAAGALLRPSDRTEFRVRISGLPPGDARLASAYQTLTGDTLVVRRAVIDGRAGSRAASPDSMLAAWQRPEPLIESSNPRIRAQARLLVGRERRPTRVAELLLAWVHEAMRPDATGRLPSAVQAFETRRGDCNEYAVLYVALARAAGLPARTVAGAAYLDGRFYYHAWAEVRLGDWVPVDPLLGQFPADAGHVRLVVGGLARQVELLRLAGALRLEVL